MAQSQHYSDFSPITDINNLRNTLNEFGVAVLPNVITSSECDNLKSKMLQYLKEEYSICEPDDFDALKPISGGMLHYYGIPLHPAILDLKTDQRVVDPFIEIWGGEKNLTTSLDGIFLGPPPELIKNKSLFFNPMQTKFHLDQASDKKEFACMQSFINLEDTEHGDGCLSVLTKSHLHFNEFIEHFKVNTHGKDWFLINKTTHYDWFMQKGCEWRMIMAPKGSMVFWDSRTVHMGTLPRQERPKANWRFLAYVCYTPAYKQSKEDAKIKREAYIQNRCTAHWPYTVRMFSKPADDLKFNDLKNLTMRQKTLLGI